MQHTYKTSQLKCVSNHLLTNKFKCAETKELIPIQRNRMISLLWIQVFTFESLTNWVFADFNWVLVKFIRGHRTVLLYFLCNINYLIAYSILPLLFDTSCLKNNSVFQKRNWVNTHKSSISVSLPITQIKFYIYMSVLQEIKSCHTFTYKLQVY